MEGWMDGWSDGVAAPLQAFFPWILCALWQAVPGDFLASYVAPSAGSPTPGLSPPSLIKASPLLVGGPWVQVQIDAGVPALPAHVSQVRPLHVPLPAAAHHQDPHLQRRGCVPRLSSPAGPLDLVLLHSCCGTHADSFSALCYARSWLESWLQCRGRAAPALWVRAQCCRIYVHV
jgi:hypothetical protein